MKKILLFLSLLATVSLTSCFGTADDQEAVENETPTEEVVVDEPENDTIIDLGEQTDTVVEPNDSI